MFRIYRTVEAAPVPRTEETGTFEPGSWVCMINPTAGEIEEISGRLSIPADYLRAALDEEERPRTETEDGVTLIVIDIPVPLPRADYPLHDDAARDHRYVRYHRHRLPS